jgi:SPP1 family predicted phage head-tail adaptor
VPDPGQLRERWVIESPGSSQDARGQPLSTDWSAIATVWADVQPLSGAEVQHALAITPTATHRVSLRYLDGLRPSVRLRRGSRVLHVESVVSDARRRWATLLCRELV